ncbi:echinoderm microtubule-associated protein-like 1 [Paramacrobiotus metropolitanus]|uniref:echinoderm microtubule-associated protein-like 1 n=1 Tax=Paramacrobiotus metropolitanus TaxID=2943436 RepID=UPI00244577A3|nr:echinoderm microtubule-associated protein-like 1 [Paramacrobiotus metropolitanus]
MEKKRSLLSRVVDAHTSGKLRRLHSSHSLSTDGHSHNESSHAGHSPVVSPGASPRAHHKPDDSHKSPGHHPHPSSKPPDKVEFKTRKKKMDSEAPGASGLSDAIKAEMTHILLEAVSKCSRQKMRFILMTLRRLGGVDGYMSYADFTRILQDNGLSIPSTASGLVQSNCSTSLGVDSEKVWKLLMEVHAQTDRDSVRARKSLHMRTPIISVFADPGGDRELLERMETELLAAGAGITEADDKTNIRFDMDAFKTAVLALDKTRQGHIPNTQLVKVCRDYGFPVKGELLKSLLIRCDDDNNGRISHRELFVLLDKAYDSALKINPRLFQKPDDAGSKKKVDAGKLLEDGAVTQMGRPTTPKSKSTPGNNSLEAGEYGSAVPGESVDQPNQALLGLPEEQTGKGAPKGRVGGRLKGFLGRKKTSGSLNASGDQIGNSSLDLRSTAGDNTSLASSIFSAISRGTTSTGMYNNNRELTANGLAERPINPVVRKIADQKLVLWPPDEYFDSVTPKLRYPKLEWVYGYSGFAHRGNIHLLWNDDPDDANNPNKIRTGKRIVYFVGLIAVVHDLSANSQGIYAEHDGLIQCLSVSGNGKLAATGQSSSKDTTTSGSINDQILAGIRIWSINSLKTLHVIKVSTGPLVRSGSFSGSTGDSGENSQSFHWTTTGVVALCFTKDNDSLVALDEGVPSATADADARLGQYRAAAGNKAPMRTLTIWSVDTGHLVIQKPCTDSAVICGLKALQKKDNLFVIFGRNLMEQWRIIPSERKVEFVRQYVFGHIPKPSIVTAIIELQEFGQVVSGDSDGNVIVWSDEMRPKTILQPGNKVPVFAVCQLNDNQVAAGSRDGKIVVLGIPSQLPQQNSGSHGNAAVTASAAQNVAVGKLQLAEEFGGVRVMLSSNYKPQRNTATASDNQPQSDNNSDLYNILIGTTANCILRAELPTLTDNAFGAALEIPLTATILTAGHFDRVTSLTAFSFTEEIPSVNTEEKDADGAQPFVSTLSPPSLSLAVTVGMDGNANCYDLQAHSVRWRLFLKDSMLSALDGFAPFLAMGTADGKLKVYKQKDLQLVQLFQANVGQGRVSCIKFSPDGSRLAVASQDSEIYIYKFLEQNGDETSTSPTLSILGKFDKHDYPPVAVDWSRNPARDDHYVIHSNSYHFENFLWDAENLDYLEESHFYRNVKWHTQSCIYGFPAVTSVTGETSVDGTVVCTEVTPTLDMVAAVTSDTAVIDRSTQAAGDQRANKTVNKGSSVLGLFSYPNAKSQLNHKHRTPSTAISAIKFAYVSNQLYLLCAHDTDGSVTQWLLQ